MNEMRSDILAIAETDKLKESIGIIFKLMDKLGEENTAQNGVIQLLITTGEEVEQKLNKRIDQLQKKVNDLEYEIGRIRRAAHIMPSGFHGPC